MPTPTDYLYWTSSLALVVTAGIHIPRIPVLWEEQMQKYMPMYAPKQLFFPLWLFVLVFQAGFGALFFQNTTNDLYDANFYLFLITAALMLFWIWLFTTPVCFYGAALFSFFILGCDVAMLVIAIEYGDTRAWVMAFISVAIAGALLLFIFTTIAAVKLGPKMKLMREAVSQKTMAYMKMTETSTKSGLKSYL